MTNEQQKLLPPGESASRSMHPVIIGFAGFILGVLAASAWFFESRLELMKDVTTDTETATPTSASVENTAEGIVAVSDQAAGESVLVDSVEVPAPGVWVAVHEVRNGELGNILGAARALGPATNISVPLLRATIPEQTYAVVLYRDNGDGAFDQRADSVYVDFTSGDRVVAPFTTTS